MKTSTIAAAKAVVETVIRNFCESFDRFCAVCACVGDTALLLLTPERPQLAYLPVRTTVPPHRLTDRAAAQIEDSYARHA